MTTQAETHVKAGQSHQTERSGEFLVLGVSTVCNCNRTLSQFLRHANRNDISNGYRIFWSTR